MLSKPLIQFSIDGWSCVPSLLFDLRSNFGEGNEDNADLFQKLPCRHCCTQCPQHCSRPLPTHASARDSWTPTGKSGSVSCGATAPFCWVLECTRFCFCPQSMFPQSCVSSGDLSSVQLLHHVQLSKTPWTTAYKAPLPMAFSRQE